MRVIAGSARSIRLQYPKGVRIRPTSDRVRESLFAALGDEVAGSRFCDLYAGAGTVGIEALSRGAQNAVFVEKNSRCLQALHANLENTHLVETAEVIRRNLPGCIKEVWQKSGPFGIVFADPPYADDPQPVLLALAEVMAEAGGLLLLQCGSRTDPEAPGFELLRRQEFGDTVVMWYHL
jgi:16S rRNA (guanine966-N2)-methyltransferase